MLQLKTRQIGKENNRIMSHIRPTQCQKILQYINDFGSITQLDALKDLGVMRLASRISEMRKNGINIADEQICVKNRYGEKCYIKKYFLPKIIDKDANI